MALPLMPTQPPLLTRSGLDGPHPVSKLANSINTLRLRPGALARRWREPGGRTYQKC
jgi:hypothetical protein